MASVVFGRAAVTVGFTVTSTVGRLLSVYCAHLHIIECVVCWRAELVAFMSTRCALLETGSYFVAFLLSGTTGDVLYCTAP